MDPVELSDGRLLLRVPDVSDVPAILDACQDPEIERWTTVPSPYRRSDAESFVLRVVPEAWAQGRSAIFAVFDQPDDARVQSPPSTGSPASAPPGLLGMVGLHDLAAAMGELGYWVAPWARRRGVAVGAARMACQFGFEMLGLQRIEWWAEVGNTASLRVATKLGFSLEGTCRARLVHQGRRVDGWVAGLLPGGLR
ncbi:MAG: GNAT family N-acetyltransferase [Actinomycetes bacterium]